ncbi:response regulator [Novosphingobium sp. PC22D]|uniref:response regulator n=1 Tax=Novosphingobium sp. PC22D TaxID=1962403 RepID=UPI001F0A44A5|nr:response regulator [Novosphingobium sp. PC22D]
MDDDEVLREIAAWALDEREELDVRMAASGMEALAIVDAGGWIPDLVVLDAKMPEMDGPQTFAGLRKRSALADTRVAFVTAAERGERDGLLALGADAVIGKPFDPETLAETLVRVGSSPRRSVR